MGSFTDGRYNVLLAKCGDQGCAGCAGNVAIEADH